MVSILPGQSNWDLIGQAIGSNISQNLPGAVQEGYNRQIGLNALDQAQKDIAQAGDDPFKIAFAFAKAGAQNKSLERALGPLLQTALQNSRAKNIYGQGQPNVQTSVNPNQMGMNGFVQENQPLNSQDIQQKNQERGFQPEKAVRQTGYNIKTKDQMEQIASQDAIKANDPNFYNIRLNQLQASNDIALAHRDYLQKLAVGRGQVSPSELDEFMKIGENYSTENPEQWYRDTFRDYKEFQRNKTRLENAFIPNIGFGLFGGTQREKELEKLTPIVQEEVAKGREAETRNFLASNYLTPTEIEYQIHPLQPQQKKAIANLPQGTFPLKKKKTWGDFFSLFGKQKKPDVFGKSPFVSYEEALEKAPKELKIMQDQLADFFLNNVNENSGLLPLRDQLIQKDYDWRQVGPALRQAMEKGLKLTSSQESELPEFESQPPRESLPDIFKDWHRIIDITRGAK